MLNLKLKLPLLALSISTALIAPQVGSAAPIKVLALGDSITNGVYNGGNALSYRDDLHLLLKSGGYSYTYEGKCPNDSSGDETGECDQSSLYSPGVIDEPATSGVVFSHEGRAGKHANYFNEKPSGTISRLEDLLTTWYFPDAIFLHIGTNDIFQQEGETNRTDGLVDITTYNETLADIDSMITTIKNLPYAPKIYLAKILPIGKVTDGIPVIIDGDPVEGDMDYAGSDGDAAIKLNQLLQTKYGNDAGVTLVDQNTNFALGAHLNSDDVHPNNVGEEKMAQNWFNKFKLDFTPNGASAVTSTLTASKTTVTANNEDFATITLQAKDSSGDNLTTGGDTVVFFNTALIFTPTVDNGDGTYTTTVKRNGSHGAATVRATLNGVQVTSTKVITFLAAQNISFTPPTSKTFGDADFTVNATSQKFNTINPTGLTTSIEVKPSSSTVCEIDASNKVTLKSVGDCTLTASQAGGTASGITYAEATSVEDTIVVNKGTQTVAFATNTPTTAFIGGEFTASATSTSGLGVSINSATPTICSIDSLNKVTIKAAGTCKLTASQTGDANYNVATPVTHDVVVSSDVITFPTLADKTLGNAPFTVVAKAQSGASVTLTSESNNICKVSGTTVTLVDAGTCELKATSGAVSATTSFEVKKNASQLAIDVVAKVINGSGSITVAQLEPIKGLKNLIKGRDYTGAIKAGTYADKNNPTVAELQTVVDKANSDANKSGGSTSPLWLLTLGFVALFRRKEQS
ncbi:MAG: invasin domain 3-containing protein [Cocleimonas sp.]